MLDLLLAEGIARFLELFGDIGPVPGLGIGQAQFLACEAAQVGDILFGIGAGAVREVTQEVDHLLRRMRHLGNQRDLAEVAVAQQLRLFLAQGKYFGNVGRVVEAAGIALCLVGGACHIGAVELRAARCWWRTASRAGSRASSA